jgi:hypothetical protein
MPLQSGIPELPEPFIREENKSRRKYATSHFCLHGILIGNSCRRFTIGIKKRGCAKIEVERLRIVYCPFLPIVLTLNPHPVQDTLDLLNFVSDLALVGISGNINWRGLKNYRARKRERYLSLIPTVQLDLSFQRYMEAKDRISGLSGEQNWSWFSFIARTSRPIYSKSNITTFSKTLCHLREGSEAPARA